jgi:hypothetical protein
MVRANGCRMDRQKRDNGRVSGSIPMPRNSQRHSPAVRNPNAAVLLIFRRYASPWRRLNSRSNGGRGGILDDENLRPTDAYGLVHELQLAFVRHVVKHEIQHDDIEGVLRKRQNTAVVAPERDRRVHAQIDDVDAADDSSAARPKLLEDMCLTASHIKHRIAAT